MGKRKSTAEDKAGEMDVDGDSSDDVSPKKCRRIENVTATREEKY
jgi:hypothetical protein